MSREDIVAVAARLLAVWLLFKFVGLVLEFVKLVTVGGDTQGTLLFAAIALAILFVAGLLWVFPVTVARKLLPVMKDPSAVAVVPPPQMATIAMALMGVWLVANAVVDLVFWIVMLREFGGLSGLDPQSKANIYASVAQLAIGIALAFGATGLRRLLFRIRYGDSPSPPASTP